MPTPLYTIYVHRYIVKVHINTTPNTSPHRVHALQAVEDGGRVLAPPHVIDAAQDEHLGSDVSVRSQSEVRHVMAAVSDYSLWQVWLL